MGKTAVSIHLDSFGCSLMKTMGCCVHEFVLWFFDLAAKAWLQLFHDFVIRSCPICCVKEEFVSLYTCNIDPQLLLCP